MSIAESILPEFDHETATTRALLERVPEAKAEWKPHAKSMSLGVLSQHIANLSYYWAPMTLRQTEFDANPPGVPDESALHNSNRPQGCCTRTTRV